MKIGKPSVLEPPTEKREGRKKAPLEWPKGNLKCDWSYIIMPHERYKEELGKRKKILYGLVLIFFLVPLPIAGLLCALKGTEGLIMGAITLMVSGFMGIFVLIAVVQTLRHVNNPRNRMEVKVGWKTNDRRLALRTVRNYVEEFHPRHEYKVNKQIRWLLWKPEDRYILPDGNIIKAEYKKINKQPGGWLGIEYLPIRWESAYMLQVQLDEYFYEKGIVTKRK